jgi:hypothetical protein
MKTVKNCRFYSLCDRMGCFSCFDNPAITVASDYDFGNNFNLNLGVNQEPSYNELVEALRETNQFLIDRMTNVLHGSEEITCLMTNKHIFNCLE